MTISKSESRSNDAQVHPKRLKRLASWKMWHWTMLWAWAAHFGASLIPSRNQTDGLRPYSTSCFAQFLYLLRYQVKIPKGTDHRELVLGLFRAVVLRWGSERGNLKFTQTGSKACGWETGGRSSDQKSVEVQAGWAIPWGAGWGKHPGLRQQRGQGCVRGHLSCSVGRVWVGLNGYWSRVGMGIFISLHASRVCWVLCVSEGLLDNPTCTSQSHFNLASQ